MVLLEGLNMSGRRMPWVQVCYFVGIASILTDARQSETRPP
jgi:hypothetical protein